MASNRNVQRPAAFSSGDAECDGRHRRSLFRRAAPSPAARAAEDGSEPEECVRRAHLSAGVAGHGGQEVRQESDRRLPAAYSRVRLRRPAPPSAHLLSVVLLGKLFALRRQGLVHVLLLGHGF